MKVDEVVRRAILHYPTLFKNRTDVLHHLFYVNGNGHEWQNGEIVDMWDSYDDPPKEYDEDDFRYGETHRRLNAENRHIRETIDSRVHDLSGLSEFAGRTLWYPESNYSLIHNIPDDVKPDWAAAAEEIRALYEAAKETLDDHR